MVRRVNLICQEAKCIRYDMLSPRESGIMSQDVVAGTGSPRKEARSRFWKNY